MSFLFASKFAVRRLFKSFKVIFRSKLAVNSVKTEVVPIPEDWKKQTLDNMLVMHRNDAKLYI